MSSLVLTAPWGICGGGGGKELDRGVKGCGRKMREGQVAPQCWVLMVETPLRLACAGHEGDRTKQVLWWEGLGGGGGGGGLQPVLFHTGGSLLWLFCG